MQRTTLLLCLSVAAVSSAGARPVTYAGTIGRIPVVAEFTAEPAGEGVTVHGRYFYEKQGIDIPLRFVRRAGGVLHFVEEAACDRERCPEGAPAPEGGEWQLSASGEGTLLAGRWSGARVLPITLRRVADRAAGPQEEVTPRGLLESSQAIAFTETIINARTAPYDHAKLAVAPETVGTVDLNGGRVAGGRVAYVRDPRTRFSYPRIVALPGGASADHANDVLEKRHWRQSLSAFGCAALRHVGFQEQPGDWWAGVGTLGGYDETSAGVTLLTDRVMSWTESGSILCGGASPNNFTAPYLMDVERGELLRMGDVFAGWSQDRPPAALVDFVNARRPKPPHGEATVEEDCRMDDLVASNLAVVLKPGGQGETLVTFGVYNLPTVIAACAGDLVTVPVSGIRDYLTPAAAELLR